MPPKQGQIFTIHMMRIIFYLISVSIIFLFFSSCSKGDIVKEPQFGSVLLKNMTIDNINVLQDEKTFTLTSGENLNFNTVSGRRRFQFYVADTLQADTVLAINAFAKHDYVLFRANSKSALHIYDTSLNGLATTAFPDSGTIKISFANLSSSLPDKVNVYVTTKTFIGNVQKEIQVGEFLLINSIFSGFKTITLGTGVSLRPQTQYTLTVKDPVDNHVLASSVITFPSNPTNGALVNTVYLLYLDGNNNVNILMSK